MAVGDYRVLQRRKDGRCFRFRQTRVSKSQRQMQQHWLGDKTGSGASNKVHTVVVGTSQARKGELGLKSRLTHGHVDRVALFPIAFETRHALFHGSTIAFADLHRLREDRSGGGLEAEDTGDEDASAGQKSLDGDGEGNQKGPYIDADCIALDAVDSIDDAASHSSYYHLLVITIIER